MSVFLIRLELALGITSLNIGGLPKVAHFISSGCLPELKIENRTSTINNMDGKGSIEN
jgi:hypothetical protein